MAAARPRNFALRRAELAKPEVPRLLLRHARTTWSGATWMAMVARSTRITSVRVSSRRAPPATTRGALLPRIARRRATNALRQHPVRPTSPSKRTIARTRSASGSGSVPPASASSAKIGQRAATSRLWPRIAQGRVAPAKVSSTSPRLSMARRTRRRLLSARTASASRCGESLQEVSARSARTLPLTTAATTRISWRRAQ
mmetsp:Transcript_158020/g.506830  ORF Transcript_158020/g.506830 Transcript_158020/m.506830 type:complete len:200 (-) Transcript_158020:416-1015(-)